MEIGPAHPQHLELYAAMCPVEVIDDCHSETLGDGEAADVLY